MSQKLIEIAKVFQTPLKLNAKAGDKVLIITDTGMDPLLWQGLATAANCLDMEPVVTVMTPRAHHAANPASPVVHAARDPEVDLVVYLTSTAMAHARITDDLVDANKKFILMEELTVAMLAPGGPAWADYEAMNRLGLKIAQVYTEGSQVRVTCPNGTDLTASIVGRPGRSIAGMPLALHPGKGGGCAFPDGEAHVCPVEGTGEGRVVFDLTAHSVGLLKEPIILTIKKGMVTDIEGGAQAQAWRKILEQANDPASYNCPAEVSIGLNRNVTPTGSMRTDKKMYATSHIGVGDTIVLGGTCHAKLRLEGVIRHPEISVDGQTLTRGGRILLDA
ncbi:aminopeptidase [Ramlibacter tataouinensis]|uniref:aminopeptidase n=1 Tax=Ramlibacter tataouinensis TaxID=94132 RepID=UPI0022F3BE71|nr:aminopeptidase [Ramlibacter tataouinensis]WBY02889.1 aminopeptidase [Ramlibacter tataouinensis]